MSNLLQETTEKLMTHNKTWNDVLWIGGFEFTISIEDFKRLANREYDDCYGAPMVAQDLKIVGKDWWPTVDRRTTARGTQNRKHAIKQKIIRGYCNRFSAKHGLCLFACL